jgi:hypothetical protein
MEMSSQHTCHICNKSLHPKGLGFHLKIHHITIKDYYDKFFKKDNEDICLICNNQTAFINLSKGYRIYCSVRCCANHTELQKQKIEKFKQTLDNNPAIGTVISTKRIEFIKQNPDVIKEAKIKELATKKLTGVMKIASEKRLKTLETHPEIQINATRKRLKTEAEKNSREKAVEKYKQTINSSPEIQIEKGKKISIHLRNKYKKLQQADFESPYYFYIIKHLSEPIIKLGISESPEKRLKGINTDFGKSKILYYIKSTYTKMDKLESYLHDYFNEHCKVQPSGSGKTEWFDECILEEAKRLIQTEVSPQ